MKSINAMELRAIEGGASKYVYCPICGYKSKSSWIERLFWSNSRKQMYLQARHGYLKAINRGWAYANSQAVHR